jgi:fibronectin-binding autotransporter adhesin
VTISGTIGTTTGTLTKDGNGTLTLSTANTFSGGTTVNAGVVSISSDGNLGAVPGSATAASITLNGGTLQSTAGLTLSANRGITLGASHGTIDASSGTLTYGGIIAGSGGLTKSGSGTLTLSGANTYTGGTTVSAGTLTLGASDRLANNGALTISSSATFNLNGHNETIGSLAGAGNVTLGAANLIAGEANTSTTYSGVISGTGGLTKRGTGTLILSGNNTYSGRHSGRCRRPAHFGQHCQ